MSPFSRKKAYGGETYGLPKCSAVRQTIHFIRYAAIISKILDERLNGEILIHKHFGVKCHEITSLLALVSTYGVFQKTFWSLLNNTSDDAGRLSSFPVDGYSKFVLPRIAFVPFGSVSSIVESPCPFKSKCAELVCSSPRAQSRI